MREGARRIGRMVAGAVRAARTALPGFRDLHVYGGLLLVAVGTAGYNPNAGLIAAGAVLILLGRPWKK